MLLPILRKLFRRDLEKLREEISLYKDERRIWNIDKDIKNDAGHLCLHLVGNLNSYIGAEFAKTGYSRNRELEFTSGPVSREELIRQINETIEVVETAFASLKDEQLEQEYPLLVFKEKTSVGYFLVHLAVHLGYHLGQVNYHRRLLD